MRFQNENENEKGGTWIFKMKILSVPFFENESETSISLEMKILLDIAIFESENGTYFFDCGKLRRCTFKVLKGMRKVKS